MGILDEAIREHLELKRQHGAGDPELKQLEDDAFGPPDRPGDEEAAHDPFAEAPTEFLTPSETAEDQAPAEGEAQSRRASPGIADLQEAPPRAEPADQEPAEDEPAEEEHPAMEHEVVPEPPQMEGHSTEERHAIAEQPTEMFDVEEEIAASESAGPSDEELVEEEIAEPRLAPVDPLIGLEAAEAEAGGEIEVSAAEEESEEDEDDDFFDEQRLSDELDQALEAPAEQEETEAEVEETDEEEVVKDLAVEDEDEGEPDAESGGVSSRDREDDVLEDTPDFLEDSEDDQLWFEQKPPKDFDFDD